MLDEMYELWKRDPSAVSASFATYFEKMEQGVEYEKAVPKNPPPRPLSNKGSGAGGGTIASEKDLSDVSKRWSLPSCLSSCVESTPPPFVLHGKYFGDRSSECSCAWLGLPPIDSLHTRWWFDCWLLMGTRHGETGGGGVAWGQGSFPLHFSSWQNSHSILGCVHMWVGSDPADSLLPCAWSLGH